MQVIDEVFTINRKQFPIRIVEGTKPRYVFVTHHGMLSNRTSFRYFENWVGEEGITISYDARANGESSIKASRWAKFYARDLRDVIKFAKHRYPGIKVIVLASSWGAAVALDMVRYCQHEADKVIAWSIPFDIFNSQGAKTAQGLEKAEVSEVNDKYQMGRWGFAWRFMCMIILNVSTRVYIKIDMHKTANNRTLNRLANLNSKPPKTSTKLFWAAFMSIRHSFRVMRKINHQVKNQNQVLYLQSAADAYLRKGDLARVQASCGQMLSLIIIPEKAHALQWEIDQNLHIRAFKTFIAWIEDPTVSALLS